MREGGREGRRRGGGLESGSGAAAAAKAGAAPPSMPQADAPGVCAMAKTPHRALHSAHSHAASAERLRSRQRCRARCPAILSAEAGTRLDGAKVAARLTMNHGAARASTPVRCAGGLRGAHLARLHDDGLLGGGVWVLCNGPRPERLPRIFEVGFGDMDSLVALDGARDFCH